jgi:hypothetical protein
MDGDLIELYKEGSGSPTISQTDSTPITDAGKAGLRATSALGYYFDDFSADDIVSGYTHPTLSAATLVPAGGNTYQPRVSYTF